ncbi:sigma-70 family RNA polymerase sigma factor [Agromyces sp. H3Y2-19a]|uniref:RNA polymerase sigma factor n=1 Tax=Agromyces chromiiresistens TaxID=3030835 RepID=UPI0023B9A343|nr:sigma-70 family RNA polymerase sigma factor [Agromyces chromiiresistens]MDF0513466.1 sigma-70 family RNA polymerase sigma factor [Agromyces chromiiresistens]
MPSSAPQESTLLELIADEPQRLRRRALSLGIHPDDADDLAQTVLLRAWKAIDGVRDPGAGTVCAWVDAIARNTAVDHLRGRRFDDRLDAESHVDAPSVDERIEARVDLRATLSAIGDLPEPLRTPLVLSALEDRSGNEIAELLGISPALVRQRIRRARQRLAAALSSRAVEPDPG